jgi:hypothetical protein
MTIPAIPAPTDGSIRRPVDVTLAPGWRFDAGRRDFVSDEGARVNPRDDLPEGSRIVAKVPSLAGADPASLSPAERDLQRYLQVILPAGEAPEAYLEVVRAWPFVERADLGPEVSLPDSGPPGAPS